MAVNYSGKLTLDGKVAHGTPPSGIDEVLPPQVTGYVGGGTGIRAIKTVTFDQKVDAVMIKSLENAGITTDNLCVYYDRINGGFRPKSLWLKSRSSNDGWLTFDDYQQSLNRAFRFDDVATGSSIESFYELTDTGITITGLPDGTFANANAIVYDWVAFK